MKIALASDVHLEFGQLELKNTEAADVLILSGDICVAQSFKSQDKHHQRFKDFFENCAAEFDNVVYVMGNHEHYNGDFADTVPLLKDSLKHLFNLHILDNETITIDDITFIGGTLWTNMNEEDSLTLSHIKTMMNDFFVIKNSLRPTYRTVPLFKKDDQDNYILDDNGDYIPAGNKQKAEASRFSPEDAVAEHRKTLDYINHVVGERADDKFVVVGHHCPSKKSIHPKYAHDTIMNGGFASDLDDFIAYRPQIKLWTHGHTHEQFDYIIGETRVVCNPRGYIGHEQRADNFKLQYIDL